MELVEDDPRLRRVSQNRVAKGLLRGNGSEFNTGALFLAQMAEEQIDVSFLAASISDPDRALKIQIADYNPVFAPLPREIASIPMHLGAGNPASSSCCCMVSLSR